MIQLCTHKVKKLFAQYKELQMANGEDVQITVSEVCDLESQFWKTEHSYCTRSPCDRLPADSQRRLLELNSLKDRAREEKQLTIGDLIRITLFYRWRLSACSDKIVQHLEQYSEERISPPYPDDLVTTLGSTIQCLPRPAAGVAAAVIHTCHLLLLKPERAEHVIEILVDAYWKDTLPEATLKKVLPPVLPLVMDTPNHTAIEECSDSDSNDSVDSVDIDSTDHMHELEFDSYASSSTDSCD